MSERGRRAAKSAKHMPDSRIDFSDIPESTEAELKRAVRAGRPKTGDAKQLIEIRISPRLLAQLRRLAAKQSNLSNPDSLPGLSDGCGAGTDAPEKKNKLALNACKRGRRVYNQARSGSQDGNAD